MRNQPPVFTAAERRAGLLALGAALVLLLAMIAAEQAWSPSLGVYDSPVSALQTSDVVDAQPLSRAAIL